jgi:hypothetical protein
MNRNLIGSEDTFSSSKPAGEYGSDSMEGRVPEQNQAKFSFFFRQHSPGPI